MSTTSLSSLSDDIASEEFADFRSERAGQAPVGSHRAVRVIGGILIIAVGAALLVPVRSLLGEIGGFVLIALSLAVIIVGVGLLVSRSDFWSRWYRLTRLAAENGWTYERDTGRALPTPELPGFHFRITNATGAKTVERVAAPAHDVPFETGIYTYSYRPDPDQDTLSTVSINYVAVRLQRGVPHVYLDAPRNGTNPRALNLDKSQTLSLEGDFDSYFTTYCPPEYERDALYLLTPDFMRLLIDYASGYDVEFVDDWALFYRVGTELSDSENDWIRTMNLVNLVGARARHRSMRYRDERSGLSDDAPETPAAISTVGRRLHRDERVWPGRVGIIIGSGLLVAALLKAFGAF